jgi:hypothetical protein
MDVLETSGKNVATQLTTAAMGSVANKVLQEVFGNFDQKYRNYQFVQTNVQQKKKDKKGQKDE